MRANRFTALVAAGMLFAGPAMALDCSRPETSSDVAACLEQELRDSDRTINEKYQELRTKLDERDRTRLRDEQRAWLKKRDAACHLDSKESDRERWMQVILADYKKTVCVVRFTRARVEQLSDMLANVSVPSDDTAQDALADNARYEVEAPNTHSKGKWYFEVLIDQGAIAKQAETALWIGAGADGGGMGNLINIRRNDAGKPMLRYGLAVDLDNGKLYNRLNGDWKAQPGSAQGLDIKLGRAYRAAVTSSVEMSDLLDHDLIQINFGDRPFAYSLPDGYRPFSD